jgi:hypothetical protein
MQNALKAVGYALACSVMGVGIGNALGAEITQTEVSSPGLVACVYILGNVIASDTPVLASNCGDRFGSYWHWNTTGVISGNGSTTSVSTCLKVKRDGRVFLFDCDPSVPGPSEIWVFVEGEVRVKNGPFTGRCLDSRGVYGLTTAAQLVVNTCTGSLTQQWTIK